MERGICMCVVYVRVVGHNNNVLKSGADRNAAMIGEKENKGETKALVYGMNWAKNMLHSHNQWLRAALCDQNHAVSLCADQHHVAACH